MCVGKCPDDAVYRRPILRKIRHLYIVTRQPGQFIALPLNLGNSSQDSLQIFHEEFYSWLHTSKLLLFILTCVCQSNILSHEMDKC